jgi:hypothetical protein
VMVAMIIADRDTVVSRRKVTQGLAFCSNGMTFIGLSKPSCFAHLSKPDKRAVSSALACVSHGGRPRRPLLHIHPHDKSPTGRGPRALGVSRASLV